MLQADKLQKYADKIHQKGAPLDNCFGFIDGTLREITRPQINQRIVYNGHKRVHGIKFQSVALPNGMIANLNGPYEGRKHYSTMLCESNWRKIFYKLLGIMDIPCVYTEILHTRLDYTFKPHTEVQTLLPINMHLTKQ